MLLYDCGVNLNLRRSPHTDQFSQGTDLFYEHQYELVLNWYAQHTYVLRIFFSTIWMFNPSVITLLQHNSFPRSVCNTCPLVPWVVRKASRPEV